VRVSQNRYTDASPEEIKSALWRRGEIDYLLHKGQIKIEHACLKSKGKLFVGDCARQTGKSTWAAKVGIQKAIKKPGARIRSGTAFLTDLEQFIIPAFELVLRDCPEDMLPKLNENKLEFRFPNKSKIKLVGLDRKPNGLRGNRLDMVLLHEAGFISRLKHLYRSVLIPSTTHVPDAKIIMESTQPESPDHDFIYFCDLAESRGAYCKLTVDENPLLTQEQVEEIALEYAPSDRSLTREQRIAIGRASTAFRREYLCERVVEESRAIVPEFSPARHVKISPVGIGHKYWHRLEALDSGVRDMTGFLCGYYDFARAKLCIEDEFAITGPEVTTRRINELVRQKEKDREYQSIYRRTADNDNLILIQDLGTEFNLHFMPTSKDELIAMVNKVRMWFGSERIEIHPRCERLIGALKAGIWDLQRKAFARSEAHGHFDLLAALVYMVRNVPEHDNPVPPYFGENLSEVVFQGDRLDSGMSKNASMFKKAIFAGR